MSEQLNLLASVRQYLIAKNEDYQWITMGDDEQRIGIAYLPNAETAVPSTFMFTELENPASLVFDAHFAMRFAREDIQELSLMILTLNANLPEGQLLLDIDGGFVYYRMKLTPSMTISPDDMDKEIEHMEALGVSMSMTYARIIQQEFYGEL